MDDWLGGENEFDWPGDPSRPYDGQAQPGSAPANGGERGLASPSGGTRSTAERAPVEDHDAIVRRRRLVALSVLAAVVVIGVVVALATSGGGNKNSSPPAVTTVQQQPPPANSSGAGSPPPPASSPPASPPPTQSQTQTPSSTATPSTQRVTLPNGVAMSSGDTGASVLAVQRALYALGYDVGSRDSNFGQTTEAAVMAFQKDQGIKQDGIVGPGTVAKLNAALAAKG